MTKLETHLKEAIKVHEHIIKVYKVESRTSHTNYGEGYSDGVIYASQRSLNQLRQALRLAENECN